jgi:undecaprenyl-diphosphatase
MEILLAVKIIIMGIVEGLTEFLPISSTGHLILAGSLLNFTGEKVKVFEIVIQAGAMLAVCWEYRERIVHVMRNFYRDNAARRFVINLIVAFLPAVVLGLLFGKIIKAHLFKPVPVALAFIVGAIIILIVERRHRLQPEGPRIDSVDDMTVLDALKVGCAQCFALIPGTSRSGASIIGAMIFGLSRKAATEFSFFQRYWARRFIRSIKSATYCRWRICPCLAWAHWRLLCQPSCAYAGCSAISVHMISPCLHGIGLFLGSSCC